MKINCIVGKFRRKGDEFQTNHLISIPNNIDIRKNDHITLVVKGSQENICVKAVTQNFLLDCEEKPEELIETIYCISQIGGYEDDKNL